MKREITGIFKFLKSIPEELHFDNKGFEKYEILINGFHNKYKKAKRSLKLSESEKKEMIKSQRNKSSLSDAPIFLGDDIEVDHIKALAIGGKDKKNNLGIAHKIENRKKGVKEK